MYSLIDFVLHQILNIPMSLQFHYIWNTVFQLERRMEAEQKEFEACSKTIRSEMERFEATRIQDFKATIISYLEILMDSQQKLVTHWEAFLPEAKAIA